MERAIRNAAKALIIKDDKMLAIKISDGKEEWFATYHKGILYCCLTMGFIILFWRLVLLREWR